MVLDLGIEEEDENIFTHSRKFDQGDGKIRAGQSTYIVALDGSGDFATIQEAINSLPSEGGVIYIKEGTYSINSQITISKDNVSLIGTGKSTIIKQTQTGGNTLFYALSKSGLFFSRLYLVAAGYTNDFLIYMNNCNNCFVSENWFSSSSVGVLISGGNSISVQKNLGVAGNTHLAALWNTERNDVSNNISNAGAIAIGYGSPSRTGSYNVVSNNVFNATSGVDGSLELTNATYNTLTGNIGKAPTDGFIVLTNSQNNFIGGNITLEPEGVTRAGIDLITTSSKNVIKGNIIIGSMGNGLQVGTGCDRNILSENIISGSSVSNLVNNGTNTQIGHNITQ